MFSSNTSQVSSAATYIEDVFSTWLYTGNSSTQTITNGINLSGSGGMVWIKDRNSGAKGHQLWDTSRGVGYRIQTQSTVGQNTTQIFGVSSFNSNGFTLGSNNDTNDINYNFASWTFRKQPKFFDVVTYTGDSTNNRQISHSLGATPGCIIIKIINGNNSWIVWHNSLPTQAGELNATGSFLSAYYTNLLNGAPTSTTFTVSHNGFNTTNETGYTYVAYLFAHNAGGFGLTGTDNVISCGSYTGNGSATGPEINLGYEPQWVLIKDATNASPDWWLFDNMRGVATGGVDMGLRPNTSGAEVTANNYLSFTATGFQPTNTTNTVNQSGDTYIYIAIRRGPMKTPTSGASVFTPYEVPASPTTGAITSFVTDAGFIGQRAGVDKFYWGARLMGNPALNSTNTNAESPNTNQIWDRMNGWWNSAINGYMTWGFKRAPGFMDVVCYTGTGSARTVTHNLGVAPELMIVKRRDTTGTWIVYSAATGATNYLQLNLANSAAPATSAWNDTAPTSSVFTVGTSSNVNASGGTFVSYLFATCPGVSKVGTYNGNGGTQQINCGFTSGARFVLIKATNGSSDWVVFDSARGMTTSTDPYLYLNSTGAEGTSGSNVITQTSAGFEITDQTGYNASGFTYIYLAIA